MVVNPYKHEQDARQRISKILDGVIENNSSIDYNTLVKQVIDNYPVSTKMVEKYIQRFYIDESLLVIKNNNLTVNKFAVNREGAKDGESSKS